MFCIITFPRNGTHMLRSALNNHPDIRCHGEVFHPDLCGEVFEQLGLLAYLDRLDMGRKDGFAMHGYLPFYAGDAWVKIYKQVWELLKIFKVPILFLTRRDKIRCLASERIANLSNKWMIFNEQHRTTQSIELNVDDIINTYVGNKEDVEHIDKLFPWRHRIYYEDIIVDWNNSMYKIQDYLGIRRCVIKPSTVAQDRRPIREIVRNFDEIKQKLLATEDPELAALCTQAEKPCGDIVYADS